LKPCERRARINIYSSGSRHGKIVEGTPLVEQLTIHTDREGKTVSIKIHYGDRTLTEKLTLR
jgi:hypothetical protein